MQTINIEISPSKTPAVLIASGIVQLTDEDLLRLVQTTGNAGLFDHRVKEAIVEHLRTDNHIPKTHDILACDVRLEGHTEMKVWEFNIVGVSRFS